MGKEDKQKEIEVIDLGDFFIKIVFASVMLGVICMYFPIALIESSMLLVFKILYSIVFLMLVGIYVYSIISACKNVVKQVRKQLNESKGDDEK